MIVHIQNAIHPEGYYCILEFQGELVGDLPGQELGKINIMADGKVEMEIGQHFLEGNEVSLKKPILVLRKEQAVEDGGQAEGGFASVCVVRKKILFKTRPKPRTTSSQANLALAAAARR